MHLDETIAAIASPPGGALRGIVRLSGPGAVRCASQIVEPEEPHRIEQIRSPHCLQGAICLSRLGLVPATIFLWPTERSYTRQPSVELHVPGSPPILEATLEAACIAGARLARPGEFTLRAFLAGRLDLTQAEAVLGVIDARSQAELDVALRQLAGGLALPLHALRERLLDLLSHVEAGLDFVEEDIEFMAPSQLESELVAAEGQVAELAARLQSRRSTEELPRVVLAGPPNSGKTSLLNALTGNDTAIVSNIAGTTRDYVSRRIHTVTGAAFHLIDTAGVDESAGDATCDAVGDAAQTASLEQIKHADIVLVCRDASTATLPSAHSLDLGDVDGAMRVWTKCDLLAPIQAERLPSNGLKTSSRTGEGIEPLRQAIAEALEARQAEPVVSGTADRCRECLHLASQALARAHEADKAHQGEELVAAEIRLALEQLGQVVGAVYTDDILDRVFSRFCIGK